MNGTSEAVELLAPPVRPRPPPARSVTPSAPARRRAAGGSAGQCGCSGQPNMARPRAPGGFSDKRRLFRHRGATRRFGEPVPDARGRIGNGVDSDWFSQVLTLERPDRDDGPYLVLNGRVDDWANADPVLWFVRTGSLLICRTARARSLTLWTPILHPICRGWLHWGTRACDWTHARAVALYRACRCVCFTYASRATQKRLLEAAAMSHPVVASSPDLCGCSRGPGGDGGGRPRIGCIHVADCGTEQTLAGRAVKAGRISRVLPARGLATTRGYCILLSRRSGAEPDGMLPMENTGCLHSG